METRRHKDIVAFKTSGGKILGFHAKNLEVAELSADAWGGLPAPSASRLQSQKGGEGQIALMRWLATESNSTTSDMKFDYVNSININVTQVCNLKCVYCEAGGDGSYGRPEKKIALDKAIPVLDRLLSRIPNSGEFTVTFVGGEPLLYPEGMKIIADYCLEQTQNRRIQLQFRVVTNGTLFSPQVLELLKEHKMNLVVSMDGPPDLQDTIRPTLGGKGSSDKVLAGLDLLAANKKDLGSITLRAIFGQHNTDVEKVYDFFKTWNFDWYEFNFDVASSDEGFSDQYTRSLLTAAAKAFMAGGELALRKIKLFDRVFDRLDRRVRVENFCDSGKSFAVIDAQGAVFKCPWETNTKNMSVGSGEAFSVESLQDIETSLIDHNNCGACWARHLCGGGCMYAHGLATGAKSSPDQVYCKRTRSLISEAFMFYLESREVAQ
jgi:uncharacterized protein